jgi:outer membrane protein OmpA-like peptidoglycan-associated protein
MKTFLAMPLLLALVSMTAGAADLPTVAHIPLVSGLKLSSVMHAPSGERENLVTADSVTPAGVSYRWRAVQFDKQGNREQENFSRFVHAADLEKATRLHTVYWSMDQTDYRGYTAWSVSTAVYDQLRATGEASFMVVDKADGALGGAMSAALRNTLKLKGTLKVVTAAPAPFPLLFGERRVAVPALHLRGSFFGDGVRRALEFWVLADRLHPLLLKSVNGPDVLQIVRVDIPERAQPLENVLGKICRVELPGVYFAFATAVLEPESDPTIAEVAAVLTRHPDWTFRIEGHTDSVGPDAANLKLSEARANAMRTRLIERHGIASRRLTASGFGETKPIESNDTIEGRARNRRVELVGSCDKKPE